MLQLMPSADVPKTQAALQRWTVTLGCWNKTQPNAVRQLQQRCVAKFPQKLGSLFATCAHRLYQQATYFLVLLTYAIKNGRRAGMQKQTISSLKSNQLSAREGTHAGLTAERILLLADFVLGIHASHTSIYCRVTVIQSATNAIVSWQLSTSYWNATLSITFVERILPAVSSLNCLEILNLIKSSTSSKKSVLFLPSRIIVCYLFFILAILALVLLTHFYYKSIC